MYSRNFSNATVIGPSCFVFTVCRFKVFFVISDELLVRAYCFRRPSSSGVAGKAQQLVAAAPVGDSTTSSTPTSASIAATGFVIAGNVGAARATSEPPCTAASATSRTKHDGRRAAGDVLAALAMRHGDLPPLPPEPAGAAGDDDVDLTNSDSALSPSAGELLANKQR